MKTLEEKKQRLMMNVFSGWDIVEEGFSWMIVSDKKYNKLLVYFYWEGMSENDVHIIPA